LAVNPVGLATGQPFTLDVVLEQDISTPFDYYLFVETPAGIYTIYFDGSVKKGIAPIVRNVSKVAAPYFAVVRPAVKIPMSMQGKTVTFYAVVVDAGKMPPVKKPADLTPGTPYVIMMDKASATIAP
jgi:hypothetical protein